VYEAAVMVDTADWANTPRKIAARTVALVKVFMVYMKGGW